MVKSKMNNIMLTVLCTTYGHEKYIRQALDSILMQRVFFSMEVLIGEDCSPDNSRLILKEYEKKYPGFFTVFYRKKNLGAANNYIDLAKRARGKYIAFLELDDYWTDCDKLQKQVDYLESHYNVSAVAAKTIVVDKNGNVTDEQYPECHSKFYRWHHYLEWLLPGQTASIVCRNYYKESDGLAEKILLDASLFPGDRANAFLYLCYGKVYCFSKTMSAYRYVYDEGESYSAKTRNYSDFEIFEKYTEFYKRLLAYAYQYSSRRAIINSEKIYALFSYRLKRIQCENIIHYLLFDLDVRFKRRVLIYLTNKAIKSLVRSLFL